MAIIKYKNGDTWTNYITPIANGGTGKTTALEAITNLGGASIGSIGTKIPDNSNLNNYTTPGTYYSQNSTSSATITNSPTTASGYKLIVSVAYSTARIEQKALYTDATRTNIWNRTSADSGSTWGDWKKEIVDTVALGSQVSGTLPIANGGTGKSAVTSGSIWYTTKDGTGLSFYTRTSAGFLGFNSSGDPASYTIPLTVANGGTGRSSMTANSWLYVNSSSAVQCSTRTDAGVPGWNSSGVPTTYTTKAVSLWAYPVGSVYIAYTSTSPASRFGGTWEQITGAVLRAANGNGTGGSDTHTLTTAQLPAHRHSFVGNKTTYHAMNILKDDSLTGGFRFITDSQHTSFKGWYPFAGEIQNTGSGSAHNNLPAYQNLYVWRRTA